MITRSAASVAALALAATLAGTIGVVGLAAAQTAAGFVTPSGAGAQRAAVLDERAQTAAQAEAQAAEAAAAEARAAELNAEREQLAADLSTLGRSIVARERALETARRELSRLRGDVASARVELRGSTRRLARLLARVQRAAREPTPSLLAHPSRPVDAARSAMLTREIAKALDHERARRRQRLSDIAAAVSAARDVEAAARVEIAGLIADEAAVRSLLDASSRAEAEQREEAAAAAARAAQLARRARSLSELARSLEEAAEIDREDVPAPYRPEDAQGLTFSEARGRILRPAFGPVEFERLSAMSAGVTFLTRPYARVIAPWGGRVRWAGDFMSEGKVVIIEPEPGFSLILAGLESVEAETGETVAAGQPIGRMGGPAPQSAEFLFEETSAAEAERERLYFEILSGGDPTDPSPWMRPETRWVNEG